MSNNKVEATFYNPQTPDKNNRGLDGLAFFVALVMCLGGLAVAVWVFVTVALWATAVPWRIIPTLVVALVMWYIGTRPRRKDSNND